jgi:hypothetical protein
MTNKKKRFKTTCLPELYKSLTEAYGCEKGCRIFNTAEKILDFELAAADDRGNKMIGKHLRRNILPGYACYRAMLDFGISNIEAVGFVKGELCKNAVRMARFSKRMSSIKHIFALFRPVMKAVLSYGYPKKGWTMTFLENNKERFRFDITSCLYCEELRKRGAPELCPAFCYTDVVSYAPLAPAVLFKRQNTLAQTGVKCDFCFERGQR